jgi:hypothetical protein
MAKETPGTASSHGHWSVLIDSKCVTILEGLLKPSIRWAHQWLSVTWQIAAYRSVHWVLQSEALSPLCKSLVNGLALLNLLLSDLLTSLHRQLFLFLNLLFSVRNPTIGLCFFDFLQVLHQPQRSFFFPLFLLISLFLFFILCGRGGWRWIRFLRTWRDLCLLIIRWFGRRILLGGWRHDC